MPELPEVESARSVIDRAASRNHAALLFRYPAFENACQIDFYQHDIESLEARKLLEAWLTDDQSLTSVAVGPPSAGRCH